MERIQVETLIIGAGIIGLAVARALALKGQDVWVVESEKSIGTGTSSRNSEVIHAGIYYPQGSLKARFCTRGKELLYDYLKDRALPYKQCGKILVATNQDQEQQLTSIIEKAHNNGVTDLTRLSQKQAKDLEPALTCTSAIISPSSGILDTHALMVSLQGDAENAGANFAFNTKVTGATIQENTINVTLTSNNETYIVSARNVINAAGLYAVPLIKTFTGFPASHIPPCHYAKGHYFALKTKNPFKYLIYPIPEKDGLGIHLTIDLSGKARFGPDVKWIDKISYDVPQNLAENFYTTIRNYWPDLPDNSLIADYAGIRPKIHSPSDPAADFMIQTSKQHGIKGLINLFGIESPGITSAMAIAEHIALSEN